MGKFGKREIIALIVILVVAISVRFYKYSEWSIDIDEGFTPSELVMIDLKSFKDIKNVLVDYFTLNNISQLEMYKKKDGISDEESDYLTTLMKANETLALKIYPLYQYIVNQAVRIKGTVNESSLRIPSVIFGILSILLVYLLCNRYFNFHIAIIVASFTILHPLIQFHSQNARYYSVAYFFSLLVIYGSLRIREVLLNGPITLKTKILFFIAGILLWAPMLVHVFLIFSIIFMLLMLIDVILQKGVVEFLRRSAYLLVPFVIVGVFVAINQLIFMKGYLGHEMEREIFHEVGGSHLIHNIISLIYNYGIYFWMIIPLGVWIALKDDNRIFRIVTFSFILNLIVYLGLSLKTSYMRHDYFYAAMPLFLIIVAYAIVKSTELYVREKRHAIIISYALSLFLIGLMLPEFVSNFQIDGNRLNWKSAAEYVQGNSSKESDMKVEIYSPSPGNLDFYMRKIKNPYKNISLRKMDTNHVDNNSGKVFVIIPLTRAGFDVRNVPSDVKKYIFENGMLERILGRNRFDVRICKLAIFRIK
jgi:hypothetical protein